MTTSTTIRFTDPHEGESVAIVRHNNARSGDSGIGNGTIGITLSTHSGSGAEVFMKPEDAEKLANAILAAVGATEGTALPQSRQIGGIIGPY